MTQRLKYVGSKGRNYQFMCKDCDAMFAVQSIPYTMNNYDINDCIFCVSKDKTPTKKLTTEQIELKKQELRERLKNR